MSAHVEEDFADLTPEELAEAWEETTRLEGEAYAEAARQAYEEAAREAHDAEKRLHAAARAVVEKIPVSYGTIGGGDFVFARSQELQAVWGAAHEVVWAAGEPFMITGPTGVGKTTLAQQLGLRRVGVVSGDLLGYPVDDSGRVLYLAMDRPRQAARSLRRMVSEKDRDVLNERFRVHEGALPFNIVREPPDKLAQWAKDLGATTIIVDSLKDLAPGLADEKVAQPINDAFQACTLNGVEVAAAHHHRKANGDNRKPNRIADVYGSVWLTAGMGSVICLWGEPGAEEVELIHLKQPQEVVGPLQIAHDHTAGTVTRKAEQDPWTVMLAAGAEGLSVLEFAERLYTAPVSKANKERARRALGKLDVHEIDGSDPVRYAL
jgi:hypothetical protein